jgi:hypothetical protein
LIYLWQMHPYLLILYSLTWIVIIYAVNFWIAGKSIKINPSKALLYISTMAALGVLGEVVFDTVYNFTLGHPLWQYHIFPIHHAYTSVYSIFLWGTVGLYMYLLHGTLKKRHTDSLYILATIFCIEAIVFEALVNLSYLAIFKDFIFYYLPGDLWHITSVQTLPLYLFAGFITIQTFEYAKSRQKAAIIGSTALVVCLVGVGILLNR